ncbi:hypothetical protein ABXK61_08985 [Burkholderia sola]|nr:hypothetical protein [Burkholderia sp. AcTa6-5]MBP0713444.1 hypothetical protein [Burkholderia sp. AcTa6-5]
MMTNVPPVGGTFFFAACDSARAGMSVPRHIDMEIDSLSMTGDFLNLAA